MAQESSYQHPTFASLDAFCPCVTELIVAGISAFLEPSTVASATAGCARFLDSTALSTPVAGYHG